MNVTDFTPLLKWDDLQSLWLPDTGRDGELLLADILHFNIIQCSLKKLNLCKCFPSWMEKQH